MMEEMKIRIIIADDNKAWTDLLQKYLKNFKELEIVGITNDGLEQIEMIKDLKPDVVVTDLKRDKGISGIEVIKKCCELKMDTDFLVTTAGYYNDKIQELKEMGITHFLFKPFEIEEMIQEIKNVRNERVAKLIAIENALNERKLTFIEIIMKKIRELKYVLRKG